MLSTFWKTGFLWMIAGALVCIAPSMSRAEEVLVVTETWPPFRIANPAGGNQYSGIDIDLLRAISKKMNLSFSVKRYPWARCLDFMKSGGADLMTGLAYTAERAVFIDYLDTPYYAASPAFYLQKGKGHLIRTYEDLYRFTIGHSINSAYFEPFNSDPRLKKFGVSKESQLIDMLVHGRLEVIIGTDVNVAYDIAKTGVKDQLEKAPYRPEQRIELFVGVSRKSPLINRRDELNRVVKELVETGVVARLAEKYF